MNTIRKREFLSCLFNCLISLQRIKMQKNLPVTNGGSILPFMNEVFIQHLPSKFYMIKEPKIEAFRGIRKIRIAISCPKWLCKYIEWMNKLRLKRGNWYTLLEELESILSEDRIFIDNPLRHSDCISHLKIKI